MSFKNKNHDKFRQRLLREYKITKQEAFTWAGGVVLAERGASKELIDKFDKLEEVENFDLVQFMKQ